MPIKILIVDDIAETRESVKKLLSLDGELSVVGEAANGEDALKMVKKKKPDIVLMDINMPDINGLEVTERITVRYPDSAVIMMTVQGEIEYMKKAMLAGARDYITKPFSEEELIGAIKKVYRLEHRKKNKGAVEQVGRGEPQIVTLFSTKGGVGKTILAANLAVSLYNMTHKKIILVDLDLQFGDLAALLNIMPKQTISHLVQETGEMDLELVESYTVKHTRSGVDLLAAPLRPEYAELVNSQHVEKILKILKQSYDYIVVDTSATFNEINLTTLDLANQILLVKCLDLLTVKNAKIALEVLESLQYREKVQLIFNKVSKEGGLRIEDVERTVGATVSHQLPVEDKVVLNSVNKGIPFVLSNPTARISQGVEQLSWTVIKKGKKGQEKKGFLKKILHR
ncbi:MAG: pilus assembly protein CpaE [Clostridia bacterium]|jgi:pilus assembly protein CpaE|nr:response regulator receiver protein [Clostridiales bacterium]MDK2985671.1 pilus assembly protein CpaE [Clostridia bacterium]